MDDLKTLLANPKAQILAFGGALLLLGALAWGIGWAAHGLSERVSEPPAETAAATSPATQTPTAPPSSPPATSASQPTSTPAPTAEDKVETLTVIDSDRGLLDVIRRACELPGDYPLALDSEIMEETRRLNVFAVENPMIIKGQEIRVPTHLCP